MSINPVDNYFRFDYVCLSFLTVFETKIKTYINEFKEKIGKVLPKLNDNKFLIPSNESSTLPSNNLLYPTIPKFDTFYDEMTFLSNNIQIEYYLTQIKDNCFDVIGNLDLTSEIEKIKMTCEGLIAFSEDIVSVKHFIYDNNTQYFGEARDTEDIKEGFGCLIYKEREQVYLGTFKEDKFVNGIIIQNNNNIIYKGEFNIEKNLFYGLKIRHNENKKVDNFFFGEIEITKGIYTGCSVKYNLREVITDNDYLANITYYHNNNITLSLQYFPKEKRKLFLVDNEKEKVLQYYTGVYLIESPSIKNKEKEKSKALLFKIKEVYYIGELGNNLIFDGEGTVLYKRGDYYKGNIKLGKKEGKGIYFNKETMSLYEGEYHDDGIIKGTIKEIVPNKVIYNGEFDSENNITKGNISYDNTDNYEGEFKNKMREGKGKYIYKSTEKEIVIEGEWKENKVVGEAKVSGFEGYKIIFDDKGTPIKIYSDK